MTMQRLPIIYAAEVDIRFDDLDAYGHVNSSRYLDLVVTSRWRFGQTHLNYSLQSMLDRGVGIYLTRSQVRYRRAINGLQTVRVESFASDIKAGSIVVISFKITDIEQKIVYADGEIDFSAVDINSRKQMGLPAWLLDYLFYNQ